MPMINDFVAPAPTNPMIISSGDIGAANISYMDPVYFGKKIPKAEFDMLWVNKVSINNPGTINEPYETPLTSGIIDPITDPKTIKYRDVEITGDKRLWPKVRLILSISCKYIAFTA